MAHAYLVLPLVRYLKRKELSGAHSPMPDPASFLGDHIVSARELGMRRALVSNMAGIKSSRA